MAVAMIDVEMAVAMAVMIDVLAAVVMAFIVVV